MAILYISEYTNLGYVGNSPTQLIQAPAAPALAEQHVAIGATTTPSAAFSSSTKFIRVVSDIACNLAFGLTPTAVVTAHLLPADAVAFYAVAPASKMAVIANS